MIEAVSSSRNQLTSILREFPEYSINSKGVVFHRQTGQTLPITVDRLGYKSVRFGKGNNRKRRHIHRLLAEAFIPNIKNKPDINHIDFNPGNNSLSNLEWVTPKENSRHSMLHERKAKKLTASDVWDIRKMLNRGLSQHTIASYVRINQSCVSDISTGVSWSWLNTEPVEGDSGKKD